MKPQANLGQPLSPRSLCLVVGRDFQPGPRILYSRPSYGPDTVGVGAQTQKGARQPGEQVGRDMFGFRPQGPELPRHGGVSEGVRQDTMETGLWMPSFFPGP